MAHREDSPLLISNITMDKTGVNDDKNNRSTLVFVMFYALGTLTFVPQNFYVTANDYWMYKFRDPNNVSTNTSEKADKTDLQTNFTSYYSILGQVSMFSFLVLTVLCATRISIQKRLIGSMSVLLILFIITLIFVWTDTDSWQFGFFVISLLIGALLNGAGGCFLITIFQLATKFPTAYLGAVLSGQSICGVLAALIQIITLAMGTSSKINAFIYFTIGGGYIIIIQVMYLTVLMKMDYFKEHLKEEDAQMPSIKIDIKKVLTVAKKLAIIIAIMIMTMGSFIMMHPAVTSLVESVGEGRWSEVFFVPVCTFLLHNLFDFIGRECYLRLKWVGNMYLILTAAIVRLVFVPLLMFCNVQPRNHLPVAFNDDYSYAIIISLFALTNGYLANLCIIQMPGRCEPEERSISTLLLLLTMFISLSVCSFFSRIIISVI